MKSDGTFDVMCFSYHVIFVLLLFILFCSVFFKSHPFQSELYKLFIPSQYYLIICHTMYLIIYIILESTQVVCKQNCPLIARSISFHMLFLLLQWLATNRSITQQAITLVSKSLLLNQVRLLFINILISNSHSMPLVPHTTCKFLYVTILCMKSGIVYMQVYVNL